MMAVLLRKFATKDTIDTAKKIVNTLAKSVLIDAELQKYCPSMIVAGLYSASFKIQKRSKNINWAWKRILVELFGKDAVSHMEHFGKYIVLRQYRIYCKYGKGCQNYVYDGTDLYQNDFLVSQANDFK